MPRAPRQEDVAVEGSPESWHEEDAETVARVDAWVAAGHPAACMGRLRRLQPRDGMRFQTTTLRLLAHCLEEHGATVRDMLDTKELQHHLTHHRSRLGEAIRRQESRLVGEVLDAAADLGSTSDGRWVVSVVTTNASPSQFDRVWDHVLATDLWKTSGQLGFSLIANAVGLGHRREDAIAFLEQNLVAAFDVCGPNFVPWLIQAEPLGDRRGPWLTSLMEQRPTAAKAIIFGSEGKAAPIEQLLAATRAVVTAEPNGNAACLGVALVAEKAPDFAIPHIVRWVHSRRESNGWNKEAWRIPRAASIHDALTDALAQDTLKRSRPWHDLLAQIDCRTVGNPAAALKWVEQHLNDEAARDYMAALVRMSLSKSQEEGDKPVDETAPTTLGLIAAAHALHQRYGVHSKKRALQTYSMGPKDGTARLRALALVRDVREPPPKPDVKRAVANIKKLPNTYTALGGSRLEKALAKAPLAFLFVRQYDEDLDAEEVALEADLAARGDSADLYGFRRRRLAETRAFRQVWEDRFSQILGRGHKPDGRVLDDIYYWTELAVLARLLSAFPRVQWEPALPETAPKRLDFLVGGPEGECFVEVAVVGTKPGEVVDAVMVSAGGSVKKTLQNKKNGQFQEGQVDLKRPCIIAVQVAWDHDIDFDGANSLYGPWGLRWSPDEEGNMVAEGERHDDSKAFFQEDGVEFLSAVALMAGPIHRQPHFLGQLCRPLRTPRYPLPPELWVAVRRALFGPDTTQQREAMLVIPGMTPEEAGRFVARGIDDPSFFAGGYHDFDPALGVTANRFAELRAEAQRRARLAANGRLENLKVAAGQDLARLHAAGIYTVRRLMEVARPADVAEGLWAALEGEAGALGYARRPPSA